MDNNEAFAVILANVASHAAGTEHGLKRVHEQGSSEERSALQYLLARVSQPDIERWSAQKFVQRFIPAGGTLGDAARFAAVVERCSHEVYQRRLEIMASQGSREASPPYNEPPFDALDLDQDLLVSLADLHDFRTVLVYKGWIAHLASTTGATNDTHWLLPAIIELGVRSSTRVRIDPFLFGPQGEFPMIVQKMTIFGKPLDWDSLANLQEPLQGQYDNFDGLGPKARTDYVWSPRGQELHFEAEEVPHVPEGRLSSGRYFHAIYNTETKQITHFDGAMRIYGEHELEIRKAVHLSRAGKAGRRVKIFRVDAPIGRDAFAKVAKSFFLWNYDLQHYFDGEVRDGYW